MKTNRILLTATLCLTVLMATSCVNSTIRLGQGGKKIKPSKNIVEKIYEQPAFDELDATLVANVKIIQSAKDGHRVVLRCPDNYLELFSIKVEEGELKLDFAEKNAIIEASDVKILVYTPSLRKIESGGVAMIKADSLRTDRLEVENNGVGSIKLSGLSVDHIDCELNGVGNIELQGQAREAELENSGVGSIEAETLKAIAVKAEVSGVGSIKCWASDRLKADVSGVGSLKYGGDPKEKQLHRTGVGKISTL